ncbi:isopentenyl-diphosphate Delta-isomerase [Dermatobacter hominis]|uniref:isopentenyl-diphosphate Delta-isomerase n=1 Tax=Dermatobacter hominis TaxID=2884263 RepID=UPI001D10C0F7|nr:isopentenyl-diphosphate Delta-isomerase [Dermatobacter hominis]UDY34933.1 isopentenyl-diphosphate Delta-isomerase [Dermatobacter hominis]
MTERAAGAEPELVVTIDEHGVLGSMEKLAAHEPPGVRHLAFSVFLLDEAGRVLLQRRSARKHHFRSRWSNSCCSHPRPGEPLSDAATRRVHEELGVVTDVRPVGSFSYFAADPDSGLVESELDHVFVGRYDGPIDPDEDEVDAVAWVDLADLGRCVVDEPERFTPWLPMALAVLHDSLDHPADP